MAMALDTRDLRHLLAKLDASIRIQSNAWCCMCRTPTHIFTTFQPTDPCSSPCLASCLACTYTFACGVSDEFCRRTPTCSSITTCQPTDPLSSTCHANCPNYFRTFTYMLPVLCLFCCAGRGNLLEHYNLPTNGPMFKSLSCKLSNLRLKSCPYITAFVVPVLFCRLTQIFLSITTCQPRDPCSSPCQASCPTCAEPALTAFVVPVLLCRLTQICLSTTTCQQTDPCSSPSLEHCAHSNLCLHCYTFTGGLQLARALQPAHKWAHVQVSLWRAVQPALGPALTFMPLLCLYRYAGGLKSS
jgi:hypothetical protein